MARVGVTRIGELTGLDRIGIPNYLTVRPIDSKDGITYYNGKGSDKHSAKAGAMMEAIERYSGERCDLPVICCSYKDIRKLGAAVDPKEIIVPCVSDFDSNTKIEWVLGYDLLSRLATYVPLNTVVCPYEPRSGGSVLFYASTNGLASGNTREEALSHALCEVLERDALAISFASIQLRPAISSLLGQAGVSKPAQKKSDFPLISHRGLPRTAARLLGKFNKAGLKVFLRNITSTAGIPSIDCTIVEEQSDGKHLVHGGCGTHPDARIAIVRALTEAAQSRLACIQGGREDLPEFVHSPHNLRTDALFGAERTVPFQNIKSYQHARIDEDVRFSLKRMRTAGFRQVVAIDLTRLETNIPVVRIVVPRAEAWTVFHLHTDRGVFGPRVTRQLTGNNEN